MSKEIGVRSLIYSKDNNRYIKAIDQRDFDDFIDLLAEKRTQLPNVLIYDFSPVINYIHEKLNQNFSLYISDSLKIKHSAIFNNWTRLKSFTNQDLLSKATLNVMTESEETINWIQANLTKLKSSFYCKFGNPNESTEKDGILNSMISETEIFIESMLCNIHSTALIDIASFKNDTVLTMHTSQIMGLFIELLRDQVGINPDNTLNYKNIVEQCCMENMGIDPDFLLALSGTGLKKQNIIETIINKSSIQDDFTNTIPLRHRYIYWTRADENNLFRVKKILSTLHKIAAIDNLLEHLKSECVEFKSDKESIIQLESRINELIKR